MTNASCPPPGPSGPGEVTSAASSHHLKSIQYLRALAALLVLVYHLGHQLTRLGYAGAWPDWPQRGVDIFFVISGVVMWLTTGGHQGGVLAFYGRRILRIAPLYYLLTTLAVVVLLTFPKSVQSGRFDLAHVFGSYFFVPVWHPVIPKAVPLLVPGWTLNCEMAFYAIFGATLFLPSRLRIPASGAALALMVLAGIHGPAGSAAAWLYGSSILLEFVLGLVLGAFIRADHLLPVPMAWCALLLGTLALANSFAPESARVLIAGLPALAIVAGAVSLERRDRMPLIPGLLVLGDASYALYLAHEIVLSAFTQLVIRSGLGDRAWIAQAYVPLGICICVGSAVMLRRHVEQPMQRRLDGAVRWSGLAASKRAVRLTKPT
ncbi:acyltransferase family protein [uncultured Methylobacterium sp.]|uniref:acyltransferase family protein n=1 Tax=uncultured Methylobacterium sp. TaxID=157278 RepID=UPI0035CAEE8A